MVGDSGDGGDGTSRISLPWMQVCTQPAVSKNEHFSRTRRLSLPIVLRFASSKLMTCEGPINHEVVKCVT